MSAAPDTASQAPEATAAPQGDQAKDEVDKGPKRITDDDLYRHSTQYRMWSFTKEHLRDKRMQTNRRVADAIKQKLEEFFNSQGDQVTPEELQMLRSKAVPLTEDEELKLVNFYAKKVQVIAQHLNLPTEVVGTSITFFRRFYLEKSVMEYDPKSLVHTTIFLACKSENYFISVDSFAKKAKSTRDVILKYEFQLLEALRFSLFVHHPYRPLHGFFLDIQTVLYGKVDLKYMGQVYDRCRRRITDALLTDVVFLFTPPQITLAVLLIEDEQLILKYLEIKFGSMEDGEVGEGNQEGDSTNQGYDSEQGVVDSVSKGETEQTRKAKSSSDAKSPIHLEKLIEVIKECKDMIESYEAVDTVEAKSVAAKNYYCQHPEILVMKLTAKRQQETESPPAKRVKTEEN